jgi:hypothetical protein
MPGRVGHVDDLNMAFARKLEASHPVLLAALALTSVTGVAVGDLREAGAATPAGTSIEANQTTLRAGMYPGDAPQAISGDFDNGGSSAVHVRAVTVRIASVEKAPGAAPGTCDRSDFALGSPKMAVDELVAPGIGRGAWTGATIQFRDKPTTNQDACKGATLRLAYLIR